MPTLEITFTGLFLFVPEPKRPKGLHVLLPGTGGTTGVHLHTATVRQLDSTRPEFTLATEDLTLTGGNGTVLFPPVEAVDLEEVTEGVRYPRSALKKPDPGPRVHARIVLPPASRIVPGQTAQWDIPGIGKRRLTHRVIWTVEGLAGTSVTLERDPFGNGDKTTEVFHEVNGVVRLCIDHLPDHVETPRPQFEAKHFQAFYRSDPVFGTGPNPILAQEPGTIDPGPCDPVAKNADTFTCMVAQVRPG